MPLLKRKVNINTDEVSFYKEKQFSTLKTIIMQMVIYIILLFLQGHFSIIDLYHEQGGINMQVLVIINNSNTIVSLDRFL
jgi:hypothetical protein